MFFLKPKDTIYIGGIEYLVDAEVAKHIRELRQDNHDKAMELFHANAELSAIKPVVENKDLAPAVSARCEKCTYVVRSKFDGSILGCCKNVVCKDYKPKE